MPVVQLLNHSRRCTKVDKPLADTAKLLTAWIYLAMLVCVFAGEELWVEDPKVVWALASLVSQQNTILKVRRKDTGDLVDIDLVRARCRSVAGDLLYTMTTALESGSMSNRWCRHRMSSSCHMPLSYSCFELTTAVVGSCDHHRTVSASPLKSQQDFNQSTDPLASFCRCAAGLWRNSPAQPQGGC